MICTHESSYLQACGYMLALQTAFKPDDASLYQCTYGLFAEWRERVNENEPLILHYTC